MRVLERRVWEADDDLTVKLDPAGELFGLCSTSWSDGVLVFVYLFWNHNFIIVFVALATIIRISMKNFLPLKLKFIRIASMTKIGPI